MDIKNAAKHRDWHRVPQRACPLFSRARGAQQTVAVPYFPLFPIPSNLLSIPNTDSNSNYLRRCKEFNIARHPARFPAELPSFFIKMLTDEDDMVMDIFAGSNTTGFVAEALNRKWLAFELEKEFLISSIFRFLDGHDFEEVKNTLEKLDNKHAGYQLHDIQCLFEQVKEQKTKGLNKGQIPLF